MLFASRDEFFNVVAVSREAMISIKTLGGMPVKVGGRLGFSRRSKTSSQVRPKSGRGIRPVGTDVGAPSGIATGHDESPTGPLAESSRGGGLGLLGIGGRGSSGVGGRLAAMVDGSWVADDEDSPAWPAV